MKKLITWLVVSSKDPTKYSLTLKAILAFAATVVTMAAGLANIQVGDLTPMVNAIIEAVQAFFLFVSAVVAVIAGIRKVYRTAIGENRAIH